MLIIFDSFSRLKKRIINILQNRGVFVQNYKVLVTDHIADEGLEILENEPNIDFEVKAGIKNEDLKKILGDYDAVITRSGTTVDEDLLEDTGKLRIIGRAGVGLDNVDIEAASKKGLIVMNAPTGNTLAATELTCGMILSACRRIPDADVSVKAKEWDRKRFMGIQLYQKVLGIVGMGRIGSNVATRMKAFGMKIMVFDPYLKQARADQVGVTLCSTLEEVLTAADVLTFHTPLTPETENLIGAKELAMMKKGSVLVNCARGGLIDEQALFDAAESGHLFAAATDVFSDEPPTRKNNVLLNAKNIVMTPHIGANTEEGQKGVAVIICEQIVNALNGKQYANAVNIPYMKSQLPEDMQRYFELSQAIGSLASQLMGENPEELRFTMVGKRFEEDFGERTFDSPFNYQPFTNAMMKGFLEVVYTDKVSYINSPYVAKDNNINVMESKLESYGKYNDLLVLTVKSEKGELTLGGTVFPDGQGRITFIDKYNLDLLAKGLYLYFRNTDIPGIIGSVGTTLGNNNVNIANFELSRVDDKGSEAVAFVLVDDALDTKTLDEIMGINGIIEAKSIKL